MKKYTIIGGIIVIISIFIIILIFKNHDGNLSDYKGDPFYLDDNYYNEGIFIDINSSDIENLMNNKSNFILFVYNNYCTLEIPCDKIFEEVMIENKIDMLQIKFEEFKTTRLYKTIKLAPSVIIFKDGKIIDYLNADSDEDLDKYQNKQSFKNWLNKYILLTK